MIKIKFGDIVSGLLIVDMSCLIWTQNLKLSYCLNFNILQKNPKRFL